MPVIQIVGFQCFRCFHKWSPMKVLEWSEHYNLPKICPKCKSKYWNRPSEDDLFLFCEEITDKYQIPVKVFIKTHIKAGDDRNVILCCLYKLYEAKEDISNPKLYLEQQWQSLQNQKN